MLTVESSVLPTVLPLARIESKTTMSIMWRAGQFVESSIPLLGRKRGSDIRVLEKYIFWARDPVVDEVPFSAENFKNDCRVLEL
ncbi:hypothetical protein H6P81_004907 [Aristolochia fimbriata]|uniref:Uncharacterized protein n=1 Tax=Aristolochia fimbriata TaxID=158543 RepID=A0AAV7ET27_ARIFI|nr:hypothetical protein H6P81_004907 [Aristolochia fimbriata]